MLAQRSAHIASPHTGSAFLLTDTTFMRLRWIRTHASWLS
jgi:hypothetical protein